MLIFSTALLFLPFIEVSCYDRVVITQSGFETIYGGVSTTSLLKETAMKSKRTDVSNTKTEVEEKKTKPCLVMGAVALVIFASGLAGFLMPVGETRGMLLTLAVVLCLAAIAFQITVGFPLKAEIVERLAEKKPSSDPYSDPRSEAIGEVMAAMMISVKFSVWFWLWLLTIIGSLIPLAFELYQMRLRKPSHRTLSTKDEPRAANGTIAKGLVLKHRRNKGINPAFIVIVGLIALVVIVVVVAVIRYNSRTATPATQGTPKAAEKKDPVKTKNKDRDN